MDKTEFSQVPSKSVIDSTMAILSAAGIKTYFANDEKDAKNIATTLIPKGSEVMTMTSRTLDTLGLTEHFNSPEYISQKKKLSAMDRKTQSQEMQRIGSAPEYAIGSVQAITQDGKIVMASNTGSQLPAYAYGSCKVVWVAGAQKIVKDLDEAFKRIYEYTYPLEDQRARQAYGVASNVSKILIITRAAKEDRLHLIIINKNLGY